MTDLAFVEGRRGGRRLVSASKDEQLKVWDLDTQHCCQTVVGHRWDPGVCCALGERQGAWRAGRRRLLLCRVSFLPVDATWAHDQHAHPTPEEAKGRSPCWTG